MTKQQHRKARPYDRTLTESMYRQVLEEYPALQENEGYRRLFQYDAIGPWFRGKGSDYPIIDAKMLARFEGKLTQFYARNYHALAFLKAYKRDVDPLFRWSRYSAQDGRARVILASGTRGITQQFLEDRQEQRRWLMSGLKLSEKTRIETDRAAHKDIDTRDSVFEDQYLVGEYLHNLPLSLFGRQVDKNYREAWEYAMRYGNDQDLATLEAIRDLPKPYYHAVVPNARLFPTQGLGTIKSDIRHVLLRGWPELDLMNCQAAIIAGIWRIDSIQTLLASDYSFWAYLFDELGVPESRRDKKAKDALKKPVYGLINGMERGDLEKFAHWKLFGLTRTNKTRFMDIPLIQDIAAAQAQAKADIENEGGAQTPYGWRAREEDTSINSFLTFITESYELRLIAAAFEVAKERQDFSIALYQYDGLTITQDNPYIIRALDRAVRIRGRELGIEARLH